MAEKEYIEREETINTLLSVTNDKTCPIHIGAQIELLLEFIPDADVEPVRHGNWFGTVCSACGESTSFYYDCKFCPHCGAKMDGGEGE